MARRIRKREMATTSGNGAARNGRMRHVSNSGALERDIVKLATNGKLAAAARREIKALRKLGLPITFQRGNEVVKEFPDGRIEVLERLSKLDYVLPKGVKAINRA